MAIVKTEKWKIDVVVNESLQLFFCAVGEKNVGQTRLFHYLSLAFLQFDNVLCRVICFDTFCRKIIVGFAFPAIGGAQSVPMGESLGSYGISIISCVCVWGGEIKNIRVSFM